MISFQMVETITHGKKIETVGSYDWYAAPMIWIPSFQYFYQMAKGCDDAQWLGYICLLCKNLVYETLMNTIYSMPLKGWIV